MTRSDLRPGSAMISSDRSPPDTCTRKRPDLMNRKVPTLRSYAAAFLDQDLSNLDFSQCCPPPFDGRLKPNRKVLAQLSTRPPPSLLGAVKRRASARGIPCTRFIREAVEHALA